MAESTMQAPSPAAAGDTRRLTYGEAVNHALRRCLAEDERVIVFGEDVAAPGGVFGVTRRLAREFGDRVFDTPISESAILGGAVGAAMMGMRPVVEIMWADFSLVALDQLVNQAANVRYVSRGEMAAPMVVRTQQGNAPGACAQHSQSLEALYLHVPGLRVVIPRTAQDAFDAVVSAVAAPDPVLVVENRTLYAGPPQDVDVAAPVRAPGWSHRRRAGDDVTVVAWGALTGTVLEAADAVAADGVEADVLELPWLNPLPFEAVLESVRRTRRLVVVHEAVRTGGFGAEVVARVVEAGVRLDAPARRVTARDSRIPAAPVLARAVLPGFEDVVSALRDTVHARTS
jgi:pyruvate/2-oxoglutarate/acetoin dehydrogenase E1 component